MGFAFVMLAHPNARGAVPLSTSKFFMVLLSFCFRVYFLDEQYDAKPSPYPL